jgi:hypothetical protein
MSTPATHLSLDLLLAYWLAETSPAETDSVEEHLMACDACGEQLDSIVALADGIRKALRAGEVGMTASDAFIHKLAERGVRLREYRLPVNGSVNCTVAPDDELLVSRLAVPLAGVQRLDGIGEASVMPGVLHRIDDIPFDPASGEVIFLPRLSQLRSAPEHTFRLVLLAVDASGARELGSYTFRHRPFGAPEPG